MLLREARYGYSKKPFLTAAALHKGGIDRGSEAALRRGLAPTYHSAGGAAAWRQVEPRNTSELVVGSNRKQCNRRMRSIWRFRRIENTELTDSKILSRVRIPPSPPKAQVSPVKRFLIGLP